MAPRPVGQASLKHSVVFGAQRLLLAVSFFVHLIARFGKEPDTNTWVVGTNDVASMVSLLGEGLRPSVRISLNRNHFYRREYDFGPSGRHGKLGSLTRMAYGPWLLGRLASRYSRFLYVADSGFLLSTVDGRRHEFTFLRKYGKAVACYFLGSEIRSRTLMLELAERENIDVIPTYQFLGADPAFFAKRERNAELLSRVADDLATSVFNASFDQMSYLTKPVHPFIYLVPDSQFQRNPGKFTDTTRTRIVHAPSSPITKGTPIVRAAIKKLELEGYQFDYVELTGVDHEVVLEALRGAQIAVNEFYAFVPGLFGIEALAAHCALVTSADRARETCLPEGANDAWLVTRYWEVYDHLRLLLDDPALMVRYADAGFDWALAHYPVSVAGPEVRRLLESDLATVAPVDRTAWTPPSIV